MKTDLVSGKPIDFAEITTHLRGEVELALLSELAVSEEIDDPRALQIDQILRPLERNQLDRRALELQREFMEAEKAGNLDRQRELDLERTELRRMLNALK